MTRNARDRREKLIAEAEGYLMLEMYEHALASLSRIEHPERSAFAVHWLKGESLRGLQQYETALAAFNRAYAEQPDNIPLLLAMAWCYKRCGELQRAIAATEQAYHLAPNEALVLYNLSCYWSLAGNKIQALSWLGRALRMDGDLRNLIPTEQDFDSLRHDPDFQLVAGTPGQPVE
jgi:tetratricopeptide (TPR) repeat protein